MRRGKYIIAVIALTFAYLVAPLLPVSAAATNLILNPSVESGTGAAPTSWTTSKWGTNTAIFSRPATGAKDGSKSIKAELTARTSGDVKWMHAPAAVTAGKSYTYTSFYKANVATDLLLVYKSVAGVESYAYVKTLPAATAWAASNTKFTAPSGASTVQVIQTLALKGWLQTDAFSLTQDGTTTPPPVDNENLIANPSMETASGTVPAGWQSTKWGANTTSFAYNASGRTGKSLTTTTTAYTDGDAKWHFTPVGVTAGKSYLYREYYKSTMPTTLVAAYQNAAGAYTYADLPAAPTAANWTQYSATLTVPAGATKVSVYHLVTGVGMLSIDDTELQVAVPTSAIAIPNASVETANGTTPASWQTSAWGTNTPTFQHVTTEGRTGSKSIKVTLANYTSGDAKWYFNPISGLQVGKQYRFTNWFKGTAQPHAVAMFVMADGTERYFGMPNPTAVNATTWTKYTDTFTVPAGAVASSVFMYINGNGWLQTDDYSLSEYSPNGFSQPLVTLTFDDGHEENTSSVLPVLSQHGFKSTQCYATSFIEGQSQAVINGVKAFANAGHEICSHTVTHPLLTTMSDADLLYELQHSKQYLESLIGKPVPNFASPYGDYDARVNNVIDGLYGSHRTVDEGFNSKDNYDKYRLRVQNILDTTTAAQVADWVTQAKADKTWLILVYHRVASNPGPYDTTPALFAAQMQAIKNSGVPVKTMAEALALTQSQL
jgi:peptidoglycan/xylan/chitin deacetylase (PgdA/CDA1 family)